MFQDSCVCVRMKFAFFLFLHFYFYFNFIFTPLEIGKKKKITSTSPPPTFRHHNVLFFLFSFIFFSSFLFPYTCTGSQLITVPRQTLRLCGWSTLIFAINTRFVPYGYSMFCISLCLTREVKQICVFVATQLPIVCVRTALPGEGLVWSLKDMSLFWLGVSVDKWKHK